MANDEVLGPRKTVFVLVIVMGCFAVLWPRMLSPAILGPSKEQMQPNQFDREAGCCEVIFETDVAVLELVNEVCNSALGVGKLSPHSAAECRKAVNETCGLDIAAFLKRNENVGRTTKTLVEIMQNSNSSCLRKNFGVPVYSLGPHLAVKSWSQPDTLKQERVAIRGMGPHPALRERGRAIPPGPPGPPPPARSITMPPHVRVRSPLSVYYEDVQPPPIPGMRPPLGSPGVVPSPKSSMGFVMPIYTICIIVFFVYTLSKLLFKRATSPYDPVDPDPHFRRRVFRDDSRTSPDKLVVTAISGLVAEVQQQMEASYAQNQQRQDVQDSTRPFTNGTILLNSGPVHIVASEYQEGSKASESNDKEASEPKDATPESRKPKEPTPATEDPKPEDTAKVTKNKQSLNLDDTTEERKETPELKESANDEPEVKDTLVEVQKQKEPATNDIDDVKDKEKDDLILTDFADVGKDDSVTKAAEEFLKVERECEKQSTAELLEEALKEGSPKEEEIENAAVKVMGMEVTAHPADGGAWPRELPPAPSPPPARVPHEAPEVKAIYLETEIPQQSRVLVAQFAEDRQADRDSPAKHSPLVVSGKMTLSLIQDAPRDTPERDLESTLDEFTTASAVTQPAAEKEDTDSEEEIEIEFEEEIEEEEEEIEEELPVKPKGGK